MIKIRYEAKIFLLNNIINSPFAPTQKLWRKRQGVGGLLFMTEFRPSSFQILPMVVKNLLIINGLFFLAQNTLQGPTSSFSIENVLALHAWQSSLFKPWQLITHMFLHGDIWHIFGNMFALWMFGSVLENLWGSKRFLTFYIICGLGAALMHLFFLNWELMI